MIRIILIINDKDSNNIINNNNNDSNSSNHHINIGNCLKAFCWARLSKILQITLEAVFFSDEVEGYI